jgi:hypothetical protein
MNTTVKIYGNTMWFTAHAESKLTYLNTNDNKYPLKSNKHNKK